MNTFIWCSDIPKTNIVANKQQQCFWNHRYSHMSYHQLRWYWMDQTTRAPFCFLSHAHKFMFRNHLYPKTFVNRATTCRFECTKEADEIAELRCNLRGVCVNPKWTYPGIDHFHTYMFRFECGCHFYYGSDPDYDLEPNDYELMVL